MSRLQRFLRGFLIRVPIIVTIILVIVVSILSILNVISGTLRIVTLSVVIILLIGQILTLFTPRHYYLLEF